MDSRPKMISARAARFPVSPAQYLCLAQDADPDCRDDSRSRWVLANATLVQPSVDMRRLQRALDKLVARHDSLRTRFGHAKGSYWARIDPVRKALIQEIDLDPLDDAAFQARIREIANSPLPLSGETLSELIVAHCAERGDVVIWRAHHAITDGFGMVVLLEDMLKLLIGLPLSEPALGFGDYTARYLMLPAASARKNEAFWKEMHRDLPKAPDIGRKAKGLEPLWFNLGDVEGRRLRFSIAPLTLDQLTKRAARENLGSTVVLFAGFLEALCQQYNTDRLAFTTLIARSDPGLNRFAGAHYFDPILLYKSMEQNGIEQAAQRLKSDIMMASSHLPSEAASQATDYEKSLVEAGIYPRQFSIHQPRPTNRLKRSTFRGGLDVVAGTAQRMGPYLLTPLDVSIYRRSRTDLRFLIREGQANQGFDLEYDGKSYSEVEIRALTEKVLELLNLELLGISSA